MKIMNVGNWIPYLFVFAAGMGIGLFYYGGLWLTLQRLLDSRRPLLLLAGSFIARLATSLALFFWIADGRFLRVITAVAGFIVARLLLTFLIGTRPVATGAKEHLRRSPVVGRRSFLE